MGRFRKAIEAFDRAEGAAGFEPPLFVDIRARREVRSKGFTGASSPFIRALGRHRYRWLPELGNQAVVSRRGPMRLVAPAAVGELLGLVLRAHLEERRVIFFCACDDVHECHRCLVGQTLIKHASRVGIGVQVEEWPGGGNLAPTKTLSIPPGEFDRLLNGAEAIDWGRSTPPTWLLRQPSGAVVRVNAQRRHGYASLSTPLFRRGRWQLPLFLVPFAPDDSRRFLVETAAVWRRKASLDR